MRKLHYLLMMMLAVAVLFTACDKDDDEINDPDNTEEPTPDPEPEPDPDPEPEPEPGYSNGTVIVNEGAFQASNASLSFYVADEDTVANSVFFLKNERPLGDVAQSYINYGTKGYAALNGSGKIEVMNASTFESVATIENIASPRYIVGYGENIFVSCWGAENGVVKVIDTTNFEVQQEIEVGKGPERMIVKDGSLYVANSGGYVLDNTLSIIDLETYETTLFATGDSPRAFAIDANNELWILCAGYVEYDPETYEILSESACELYKYEVPSGFGTPTPGIQFSENVHLSNIAISPDGNTIYAGGGYAVEGIFTFDVATEEFSTEPLIDQTAYGFSVNSENGNLFVCVASDDYVSNGTLYRYDSEGNELGSYEVGVGPNGTGYKNTKRN